MWPLKNFCRRPQKLCSSNLTLENVSHTSLKNTILKISIFFILEKYRYCPGLSVRPSCHILFYQMDISITSFQKIIIFAIEHRQIFKLPFGIPVVAPRTDQGNNFFNMKIRNILFYKSWILRVFTIDGSLLHISVSSQKSASDLKLDPHGLIN